MRGPGSAGGGSDPWRIFTRTSRQSGESSRRLTSSPRPALEREKRGECLTESNFMNLTTDDDDVPHLKSLSIRVS